MATLQLKTAVFAKICSSSSLSKQILDLITKTLSPLLHTLGQVAGLSSQVIDDALVVVVAGSVPAGPVRQLVGGL